MKYIKGRLTLTKRLKNLVKDFQYDTDYEGAFLLQVHDDGYFKGLFVPPERVKYVKSILKPLYDECDNNG